MVNDLHHIIHLPFKKTSQKNKNDNTNFFRLMDWGNLKYQIGNKAIQFTGS